MKMLKNIKYHRVWLTLGALAGLLVLVAILAKSFAFFNQGASRLSAMQQAAPEPEAHVAQVVWLPSPGARGRPLEAFNKETITREYLHSWYFRHLANTTGDTTGLRDYFTTDTRHKLVTELTGAIPSGLRLQQIDLQHQIQLHYFSADGQLISFTDHAVKLKQRLYNSNAQRVYAGDEVADFDVVMILQDGRWRIKLQQRLSPSTTRTADTLPPAIDNLVTVRGGEFVCKGKPFLPVGVNYYPANTPWDLFWPQYDSVATGQDFDRVVGLGFNTIRIFIGFRDFNKGRVPADRLQQLGNLLNQAYSKGLHVIVTLFDFLGDYALTNFPATDRQLEQLLTSFRHHKAILAWDLKNEPDLDFHHHVREDVLDWLEWMAERARTYDPNHLITIGWADPAAALLLQEQVDFISFHSYKPVDSLDAALGRLKGLVKKPVMLEEFGASTYRGLWAPNGNSEKDQAAYFSRVRKILQQHGNIPYLVWTLHDFTHVPAGVTGKLPWRRKPQSGFGLLRKDGSAKPGAAVLRP